MEYFNYLVEKAREEAQTAMAKFPQPNYVLNKLAEEHGEVVKGVIHFTEGRESWPNVEKEIVQNLAMLIRLVTEGDQVIGFTPPESPVASRPIDDSIPVDPKIVARNMRIEKAEELRSSGRLESYTSQFLGVRWNWHKVKDQIGYDFCEPITAENINEFCLMCEALRVSLPNDNRIRSGPFYEICDFAEHHRFGE